MQEALRDFTPPVTIEVAGDGEQALSFLRQSVQPGSSGMPKLIFLDFNLPKTDSRSVLRTIKEDQKLRLIPVAVLTASESDRDIRDAYSLYANCYLRKPVDLDSFLGTIRDTAHFWLNVAYLPG